jgi:hypothetical protein
LRREDKRRGIEATALGARFWPRRRLPRSSAGGGSIADWLSDIVGPTGDVVATDHETRALELLKRPNLEVRRHDAVNDNLETGYSELINARLFLEHLPERCRPRKTGQALRPGGWMVMESVDYGTAVPISELGANEHDRSQAVRLEELAKLGLDTFLGRKLPVQLRAQGLVEVGDEGACGSRKAAR